MQPRLLTDPASILSPRLRSQLQGLWPPVLVVLLAVLLTVVTIHYGQPVAAIDWLEVGSETLVATVVLGLIVLIQRLPIDGRVYLPLGVGLSLFFFGELQSLLNKFWLPPAWIKEVDFIGSPLGLAVTAFGIALWVQDHRRRAGDLAEHYRQLTESLSEVVYQADPADFATTYINPAAERLFGRPAKEFLHHGDTWQRSIHPEDRERVGATLEQARNRGEATVAEYRIVRADGEVRWVEDRVTWERDSSGELASMNGVVYDITDRKEAEAEGEKARKATEEAALREETFANTLIDSLPGVFYLIDADSRYVRWNRNLEKVTGLAAEELAEAHPLSLFPPEEQGRIGEAMAQVFDSGSTSLEARLLTASGEAVSYFFTGYRVELQGQPFLAGLGIDVSQRKQAEAVRDQMMALMEATPDFVGWADTEGNALYINSGARNMLGLTDEHESRYRHTSDFHPDWANRILQEEGLPTAAREGVWTGELALLHPGGGEIPVSFVVVAHAGADGEIKRYAAIGRDIRPQKEAEERLFNLIESSPIPILLADELGSPATYINHQFERVLGYSLDEMTDREAWWQRVFPDPAYRQRVREAWDARIGPAIEGYGNIVPMEATLACADGSLRTFRVHATTIGDQALIMFVDLTELREAEARMVEAHNQAEAARDEAEAANRAKSEFLAKMSHEIRTPMNAILGMGHLLLQTELNTRQRDYVEKLRGAANALLGLINDILDISKVEAGRLELEATPFSLDEVLDNLANVVTVRAAGKDIEVLFERDPAIPDNLVGDPLRLGQVLMNLATNAIKFTEAGEVVISTQLVDRDEERGTVAFSVRDTGIGLSEDQQAQLFGLFSQADNSITRKYGGTGLGLAISQRLVEIMGGTIEIDSTEGVGSRFGFTLSLPLAAQATETRQLDPAVRDSRLLIVDDHPIARDSLSEMVRSFGMAATAVESGEAAVDELERAAAAGEQAYRAVLMDWKLPDMDGVETSQRIRTAPNITNAPVVVMVTAYGREEVMQQAQAAGLEGFLVKPVSPSVLLNTLNETLGGETTQEKSTAPAPEGGVDLSGHRLLVVDDHPTNLQLAQEVLEAAGAEVVTATNGLEAVARAGAEDLGAVLMDIHMPEMDGFQAAQRIRADLGDRSPPIIAMTARALAGDREDALAAGMDDYIAKPIEVPTLLDTLARWLGVAATDGGGGAANETNLPQLAGIDMDQALARLGGSAEGLWRLLRSFAANEVDRADRLEAALDAGQLGEVADLAHGLKGAAANVSANGLSQLAQDLERAARAGDTDTAKAVLPDLRSGLSEVMGAIAGARAPGDPGAGATTEEPDWDRARRLTHELADQLAKNNLAAGDTCTALRQALGDRTGGERLTALTAAVDRLDYAAAREELAALSHELGLHGDEA